MKVQNRHGVELDTFIVVQRWPDYAHWAPRVMNEQQIGDMLAHVHYGHPVPDCRIYDVDSDGEMVECQFRKEDSVKPLAWDYNDYADMQIGIERIDTKELVGTAFCRIDGRA